MIVVNVLKYRYSIKILEIVERYELVDIIIFDIFLIFFKEKIYFLICYVLDLYIWCFFIVEYVNSILNIK